MGTLGANNGATFTSDGTLGGVSVVNPANAQLSDNSYATCGLLLGQISNYLKVTNFGFTIPLDATVTGITVSVERNATSTSAISDNSVRLVKGGTITGNDKASGTAWTTSDVVATYGSASDLWGVSLTATDVNDSGFGVVISASSALAATVNIDWVGITIDYTGSNKPGNGLRQLRAGEGMSRSELN